MLSWLLINEVVKMCLLGLDSQNMVTKDDWRWYSITLYGYHLDG